MKTLHNLTSKTIIVDGFTIIVDKRVTKRFSSMFERNVFETKFEAKAEGKVYQCLTQKEAVGKLVRTLKAIQLRNVSN